MLITILLLIAGLAILLKGADWLVDGASSIALRYKVAPMVIGLTIVAFGTSAPELLASVVGAVQGSTGLAFGNIVGSNLINTLIILGIAAIVYPLRVRSNTVFKEIPMSFLGAIVLAILGLQAVIDSGNISNLALSGSQQIGEVSFSNGLILLSFFIIYLYYTFGIAKVSGDEESVIKELALSQSVIFIILGLIGLAVGSILAVNNAVQLAQAFGVSDTLIGLTVIAFGTSLPELLTSVAAARKKQTDIAVGNVVGSNIFNIFLILGVTSLFSPIPVIGDNLFDIVILFGATFVLFFSGVRSRRIGRTEGIFMVIAYFIYLGYIIIRG